MIYKSIGGSRAYGLEVDTSDIDTFQVTQETKKYNDGTAHIIQLSYDNFINQVLMQSVESYKVMGLSVNAHNLQLLFPSEFLLFNDLTAWILENRETMVNALRPKIYRAFMDRAEAMAYGGDRYYPAFPKRLVSSTHFCNVLYNYANGMTFAEAHKCQDDIKDFLISARKKEADKEKLLEVNAEALKNAASVASFYTEASDTSILDEFKSVVQAEINNPRVDPVPVEDETTDALNALSVLGYTED